MAQNATSISPNAILLQILLDAEEEARASRAENMMQNLKKARIELEKYPLPISCGKDALVIKFVGDRIAKLIDEKLPQYLEAVQKDLPALNAATRNHSCASNLDEPSRTALAVQKRCTSKVPVKSKKCNNDEQSSVKKEYVPRPKTGNWAVLIALYLHALPGQAIEEATLKTLAQRYSKESMTAKNHGMYTSFSSVNKKLCEAEKLVIRKISPKRYLLSPKGRMLAERLWRECDEFKELSDGKNAVESMGVPISCKPSGTKFSNNSNEPLDSTCSAKNINNADCLSSGITEKNNDLIYRDQGQPSNQRFGFFNITPFTNGDDVINLDSDDETDKSPIQASWISPSKHASRDIKRREFVHDNSPCQTKRLYEISNHRISSTLNSVFPELTNGSPATSCFVQSDLPEWDLTDLDLELTEHTIDQVVLFVDNREKSFKNAQSDQEYFQSELSSLGVSVQTRSLVLGDFLWVGISNLGKYIVLDTIIERKTVSDLASSIVDKRYLEQKWRLRHSGLSKIIYLIEGNLSHLVPLSKSSVTPEMLDSALVTTETLDSMIIIRSKDYKTTVAQLYAISTFLETKYKGKKVLTTHYNQTIALKVRHNGQTLVERSQRMSVLGLDKLHFSYEHYEEHNAKRKMLPLVDCFGKQLMRCPGITMAKAAVIVNQFKTPRAFMNALKELPNEESRIKLIADLRVEGRRVGEAGSKAVLSLFWGTD
ncbi:crossover junction endonuclease MUS81-like isoform X2 [Schistocerca gregaria]|uniref:crossover junction endonuclease MUS81-like isoform X2 n=1 Tax=Schistocerca gregaria TaxID=7010 RepID=UPI00211DC8C9|nr:crossover junction endonuclease MUS81-like isoform X2 [Schistocerca gregaria]